MDYNNRRLGLICGKGFERAACAGNVGILMGADPEDHHGATASAEELPVEHARSFGGERSVLYISRWGHEFRRDSRRRSDHGKIDYGKIESVLRASGINVIVSTSSAASYSSDIPGGSLVVPRYYSSNGKTTEFDQELREMLLESGGTGLLDFGTYIRYRGQKNSKTLSSNRCLAGSSVPREYKIAEKLGAVYACIALVTRNRKTGKQLDKTEVDDLTLVAADALKGFVSRFTKSPEPAEKK